MSETGDWRYVYASIPGVAHQTDGTECQDASAVQVWATADADPVLLLVVADGAGSAAQSRVGAELACQTLIAEWTNWLLTATGEDWTQSVAERLLQQVQTALIQRAEAEQQPVREFACTLLGAALTRDRALFLQVGDGAIVIGNGHDYRPVFWPHTGQYPNETWFVTDPNAAARLECAALAEPVAEIALLSDGLQPLALHYQSRQAHAPFFRPLFQRLRTAPETGCSDHLTDALRRFLDAPSINQRTHDDKTLILACRLAAPVTMAEIEAEAEAVANQAGADAIRPASGEGPRDEAV